MTVVDGGRDMGEDGGGRDGRGYERGGNTDEAATN